MNTRPASQLDFYRFLGIHSLLIGLFPFFIPVYLWNAGIPLSGICAFITVSGLSFCLLLRVWERCAQHLALTVLMAITLVLELLLLAINLRFSHSATFILWFGIANGAYNCFFWTTQRTLFLDLINNKDSGRKYGNFQIFVMVFLKSGIFMGGLLLEQFGYTWVFVVSLLVVVTSLVYIQSRHSETSLPHHKPVTMATLRSFSDNNRSRLIFLIDGLFLFLESHFWTISLFMLAAEDYSRLGVVVIVLAVLFAVIFFVAKNTIDRIMGARIYQVAVIMYAASWALRSGTNDGLSNEWLFALLLLITFFSSFFRLAFNKQFYDIAKASALDNKPGSGITCARDYLIIKSYYTQFALAIMYALIALLALSLNNDLQTIKVVYLAAAILALCYVVYKPVQPKVDPGDEPGDEPRNNSRHNSGAATDAASRPG